MSGPKSFKINKKTLILLLISLCVSGISLHSFSQEDVKDEEKTRKDSLSKKQIKKREFKFIQFAEKGKSDSVFYFLDQGTDINARTWDNYTALIFAAQNGHLQTVKILLYNGAEPNLKSDSKECAIVSAAKFNHIAIVDILLQYGANIDSQDGNKTTALIYASAFDEFELVDLLLFYGADPNIKGKNDETALNIATAEGYYSIVKLLLEHSADPKIPDKGKNTPLYNAARNADLELTGLLIDNNANINAINTRGYSPLDAAIINNDSLMVSILLEKGADPFHKIDKNRNTLTLAKQYTKGVGITKMLRAKNVKRIRTPYIEYTPITIINSFNIHDFMTGVSIGLHEGRYNMEINTGYLLNPWEKTILVERGNSVYYQLRERRHMFYVNFEKHFRLSNSFYGNEIGIITGIKEYFLFGKYQGLEERPKKSFFMSPGLGFYYRHKLINTFVKYEYLDLQKVRISPHRIILGISFLINK